MTAADVLRAQVAAEVTAADCTPELVDSLLPVFLTYVGKRTVELEIALASLVEAVARGDEVGLPEAYRQARRLLRSTVLPLLPSTTTCGNVATAPTQPEPHPGPVPPTPGA